MVDKPSGHNAITPSASIGLRELLDGAPDVIFCCDTDGHFQ